MALLVAVWWLRERRIERQRKAVGAAYALSEDIITASSPAVIGERLVASLPRVVQASAVQLFIYSRTARSLERVPTGAHPEPIAIPVEDPPEGLGNAAAVCFRNRTALSIPDVRRNPLVNAPSVAGLPRSALFVPLLSNQEPLGVLQIENDRRVGYFSPEDQAAAQHLANQVGAALKLLEQHAMREQLFRGEKLAATGQLISAVASELRAPLDSIAQLAKALGPQDGGAPTGGSEARLLAAEAERASEIVSRLVSFAEQDRGSPGQLDITAMLTGLAKFREPEWRALSLRVKNQTGTDHAFAVGIAGQIEQVLLTLLVHAEQRAAASAAKTITLKTSVLAGRVLTEIDYSVSPAAESEPDPFAEAASPEGGALSFDVCRGIIQNHGGDIRRRRRIGAFGFEVELPAAGAAPNELADASMSAGQSVAPLTLMLVDSDSGASRQMVAMLGGRGHRVIPSSAEEAVEMARRLRFDGVLWAVRSGRSGWSEFQERVGSSVPAFVLISDGFNQELAASLEQNGGFLLARPVQEAALDRVLSEITARTSAV